MSDWSERDHYNFWPNNKKFYRLVYSSRDHAYRTNLTIRFNHYTLIVIVATVIRVLKLS